MSIAFLSLYASYLWADTQEDISSEEAISIIDKYEEAYMNKDLNKMLEYVDQGSKWFQSGFLEEFKAMFNAFTHMRLYHFKKRLVAYVADGVEIAQNTLHVAYSSTLTDVNEFTENYYLKKVSGVYKIAECTHLNTNDVLFVDKGTGAMLENNADEAISYFKKALESNPENSAAHCRLGTIYSRTGKPEEALQELEKAIELRPNVGFYRFMLSQIYFQLGNKEKASEEISKAIMLDPGLKIFFGDNSKPALE